jgi:hypothetical protein
MAPALAIESPRYRADVLNARRWCEQRSSAALRVQLAARSLLWRIVLPINEWSSRYATHILDGTVLPWHPGRMQQLDFTL